MAQQSDQFVWAVVRMDGFLADVVESYPGREKLESLLTLKEVLPTAEEADAEAERLNALRARSPDNRVTYFVLGGKYFPDGRGVEVEY